MSARHYQLIWGTKEGRPLRLIATVDRHGRVWVSEDASADELRFALVRAMARVYALYEETGRWSE